MIINILQKTNIHKTFGEHLWIVFLRPYAFVL